MVRRGRSGQVTPPTLGQRRLDESFETHDEAREEAEFRHLRETRGSSTVPPYEERVAAWVREREEALRKRPDGTQDGLPPPGPLPRRTPASAENVDKS